LSAQPNPTISGPQVVCPGAEHFYATPYQPGSSWVWTVTQGGDITQNLGNYIAVKWLGPTNSSQLLTVAETNNAGASVIDQFNVLIKNTALACENFINVSLDQDGLALITPDMLLDGTFNSYQGFNVTITKINGVPVNNPLTCSQIGGSFIGKVTDYCSGISCWTNI
jgi:hypothetical protein